MRFGLGDERPLWLSQGIRHPSRCRSPTPQHLSSRGLITVPMLCPTSLPCVRSRRRQKVVPWLVSVRPKGLKGRLRGGRLLSPNQGLQDAWDDTMKVPVVSHSTAERPGRTTPRGSTDTVMRSIVGGPGLWWQRARHRPPGCCVKELHFVNDLVFLQWYSVSLVVSSVREGVRLGSNSSRQTVCAVEFHLLVCL